MRKNILILLLTVVIAPTLHAETMQGGPYTLNGSIDVINNQGTGGQYTLNPNGDSMGATLSGGSYTLYPTPYSNPVTPTTGAVIQAIMGSSGYSTTNPPVYPPATSTTPDQDDSNNPQNPNNYPIVIGPNGTSGYYNSDGEFIPVNSGTNYGYPNATDTVNFGKGSSTSDANEEDDKPMSPVAKTLSWLLLIVLIIAILRRVWNKVQGRL